MKETSKWPTVAALRARARPILAAALSGALASVALQLGVPAECQALVVRLLAGGL